MVLPRISFCLPPAAAWCARAVAPTGTCCCRMRRAGERMMARLGVAGAVHFGLAVLAAAAALRCPDKLPADHAGFEQVGPSPRIAARLDRLRLFDGPPGEETKQAPADLAPDRAAQQGGRLTATWRFTGDEDGGWRGNRLPRRGRYKPSGDALPASIGDSSSKEPPRNHRPTLLGNPPRSTNSASSDCRAAEAPRHWVAGFHCV